MVEKFDNVRCPICNNIAYAFKDLEFDKVGIIECKKCKQGFGVDINFLYELSKLKDVPEVRNKYFEGDSNGKIK